VHWPEYVSERCKVRVWLEVVVAVVVVVVVDDSCGLMIVVVDDSCGLIIVVVKVAVIAPS
jgi:hypothetical protein